MAFKNTICFFSRLIIGVKCVALIFKKPKVNTFTGNRYVCLPFLGNLMPRNPFIAGFIVSRLRSVKAILLPTDLSKVFNSVVASNPINMVYFFIWPNAISHCPSYSMCWNNYFVNAYLYISKAYSSCLRTFFDPLVGYFPSKNTRVRVIGKAFVKCFYRKFFHKHNIQHFLNGDKYGIA